MRILERATTDYQKVVVRGDARQTEFCVQGAVHAWWHESRYLNLAWSAMAAAAMLRPGGPPKSILMLGLAGGTVFRILRHLLPQAKLTAVEIDPGIIDLARRHMHLDDLDITVHVADAREWLIKNRRRYDMVIDDCYLAGIMDVYRPLAMDASMLGNLIQATAAGGILSVNLLTCTGHRKIQSAYRKWFKANFNAVGTLSVSDAWNEVLVGGTDLGSKKNLGSGSDHFTNQRDIKAWNGILVRRI